MDTRMYVITHKMYDAPSKEGYISLHVGRALGTDLGFVGDDSGDNISAKNKNYCELTGMYWIWKNVQCDVVGICHYRRFFVRDEMLLSTQYIDEVLSRNDVILPNSINIENDSLYEHYKIEHNINDLLFCREAIEKLYPQYLDAFELVMSSRLFTVGNMMITKKSTFDRYCEWLFSILDYVEKRVDISGYNDYQKRIFGFLSERLLRVWIMKEGLKVKNENTIYMDEKFHQYCNECKNIISLKKRAISLMLGELVKKYSNGEYYDIVDNSPLEIEMGDKIPVWLYLWQGDDKIPTIVDTCIKSIRKNLPYEEIQIILVTLENVGKYIKLPQWIIDKYNNGVITDKGLSDIIEMGLLYRYGGMWIDATYYLTKVFPRKKFEQEFFTLKMCPTVYNENVSHNRWTANLMYGKQGNVLFRFVLNAIYEYWKKNDTLIDYQLIDYIIDIAYDNIYDVKHMIDECEFLNDRPYAIIELMQEKSCLED